MGYRSPPSEEPGNRLRIGRGLVRSLSVSKTRLRPIRSTCGSEGIPLEPGIAIGTLRKASIATSLALLAIPLLNQRYQGQKSKTRIASLRSVAKDRGFGALRKNRT